MAEIDLQKKSSSVWPWILGLLALALVVWMLIGRSDSDDMSGVTPDSATIEQSTYPSTPATTETPASPVIVVPQGARTGADSAQ